MYGPASILTFSVHSFRAPAQTLMHLNLPV